MLTLLLHIAGAVVLFTGALFATTTSSPIPTNFTKKTNATNITIPKRQIAALWTVGAQVVRGQDWEWGSEDGGSGSVGTVTSNITTDGWVWVRWDTDQYNYRMGYNGKYDLKLFDPSAISTDGEKDDCLLSGFKLSYVLRTGNRVIIDGKQNMFSENKDHKGIGSVVEINGYGWVRVQWDDGESTWHRMGAERKYDLILACSKNYTTTTTASSPTSPVELLEAANETETTNTLSGRQIVTVLTVGRRVVRGEDWEWGNEDGGTGSVGIVTSNITTDGWVWVRWDTDQYNYRMGYNGKYDLKLFDPSKEPKSENGEDCSLSGVKLAYVLKTGARVVRVEDMTMFSQNEGLTEIGTVVEINSYGWIRVQWDDGKSTWHRMGAQRKYELILACSMNLNTGEPTRMPTISTLSDALNNTASTKNYVQESNRLFGLLVGKEMYVVPTSRRIQTMQNVLEVFKRFSDKN